MAKQPNGRFYEYDFENVFIRYLEDAGWTYEAGADIERTRLDETLIISDLKSFLQDSNPDLTQEDIENLCASMRLIGGQTQFETLHKAYNYFVDGMQYTPSEGIARTINFINFEEPQKNIFKVVNQFAVEYVNNNEKNTRRPDILLYVNGLPLCIMELKNPADDKATIHDAFEQITVRYWRDIPHLLHYCPLACISDGVKTRLGTVRTPYEHFYTWRRINDSEPIASSSLDEFECLVYGVYEPARFLEIFRDYIYFQDKVYDASETEIVCRYPQFFATRLLKESIKKSVAQHTGKGGTYFGATGCGKTYTMAFLARQLSLRCQKELGSPTVLMIVDRDDLQKQGIKLFGKSKDFLSLGEVKTVKTRKELRDELKIRESGGFYITTIQKFCDRKDDPIGLINERSNIICFSDEAHRTQLENAKQIKFTKDADQNMRALVSKPYAKVLREALPNATFVGFTGTPIDETYQTFGDEIDRYTMDQAVADSLTVPIKYHPRIAKVLADQKTVAQIEAYYKKCAQDGATAEDIKASKEAMSSMEIILGEPGRLAKLATDIHDDFTSRIEKDPDRIQKAMIVCANRKIAYNLLCQFKEKYPEWFVPKKHPDGMEVPPEKLAELEEKPYIAMVASVGSNDEKSMYDYLGGVKNDERNDKLDAAFKQDQSNLTIVIVVDMWITGFSVDTLTYMYNDKPLQKHGLIQTISRVNRKYPGKKFGLIIDYIGIRDNMLEAMKLYGGGSGSKGPSVDDIEQATEIFRENLEVLKSLFKGFDLSPFMDAATTDIQRYKLLNAAAEYVYKSAEELNLENKGTKSSKKVSFKTYFLKIVQRLRAAYDICQPSGGLSDEESALAQSFMAIAGFVRKMSGTTDLDTDSMNKYVAKMVEEALKYSNVENILQKGDEVEILGSEFLDRLANIKMPATRLEVLMKLLRKKITEYGKVNKASAKKYKDMLDETIAQYHERRKKLSAEEAGDTQDVTAVQIIANATIQAENILKELNEDKERFRKLGLTFEEMAFYDILIKMRDEKDFEYGEDIFDADSGIMVNKKIQKLAKKIKELIDLKSSFTDWLNNTNVRNQLKSDIKFCLFENGYPPIYSQEVFSQVMEQVENYKTFEEE
ncbi:MAG: HsdR family type I site-specific deoxyribonuclease [Treponema sp.]|nr:HsdR family type I site-specific deoxyribonuclease [Treponema sp.]